MSIRGLCHYSIEGADFAWGTWDVMHTAASAGVGFCVAVPQFTRPVGGVEPRPKNLWFLVRSGRRGSMLVVDKWGLVIQGRHSDVIVEHRVCTESEAQDWAEERGCELL